MAPSSLDMLSAYALPAIPHIDLPPIPQIANPEHYEIVTTHSSLSKGARSSHDLAPKVGLKDYEKLEHVGDALLGAVVAVILHDIFPKIGEGPATMLKGQLVSNAILAQISLRYGLPALLRTDPGAQYIVRNQVKTQASVFEAWVAGVYYTVLDSLSDDEGDSVEGDKEEAKGGAAQSGEEVQTTDAMGVEETEEAETVRDKGKAGRIVRFDENVKVEVIENGSELGGSSSGSASPKDAVGEEQSPGISPVKRTVYTPVEGEHISLPSGSSSVKDDASDSSESANVVGCPFAELLSAQARSGIATPLIDESTSLEPIIEDSPNSPGASPSPASSAVSPAVEEIEDSNIPTIPRTAETLEKAQRNTIRLRWLAMCVLDDWLRPIFTPLASWAMTCLREEQIRIRAARTKAYMDVDALDAKTKGCLAILHSSSQKGDIGVPVFESEQVEDGWKVHCKVVRRDGVEFTAESIRTAKRPAHNIAAYRVIVQLGLVEDVEELAKVKEKIAEAATTAGVPHFAASAGVDESGVGARGEAAKSESASGVNATP